MKKTAITFIAACLLGACNSSKKDVDASGTFEAEETIISAQATGLIRQLTIEEGSVLKAGDIVGYIDSVQLYLKKKQLEAQVRSTLSAQPDVSKQLAALKVQLAAARNEQQRMQRLVKADAATPKQLDDVNAQVEVLNRQVEAQQSSLGISSNNIKEQANPLQVQVEQLNDQLSRCTITNPVNGTVLGKYANANEVTAAGKALYKIADLSTLLLRAYITGDQFATLKLNQHVKVIVYEADNKSREYMGTVEWISNKAEFTPKTIQTKDERANLVYAVKIRVKNDDTLKIGMYADVTL